MMYQGEWEEGFGEVAQPMQEGVKDDGWGGAMRDGLVMTHGMDNGCHALDGEGLEREEC